MSQSRRDRKRAQFQQSLRDKANGVPPGAQIVGGPPPAIIPIYHSGPLVSPTIVNEKTTEGLRVNHIGGQSRLENATVQIVAAILAGNSTPLSRNVIDEDPEVAQDATNRLVVRAANIARAAIWASSAEVQQRLDAEDNPDAQADQVAADDMENGVEALPSEVDSGGSDPQTPPPTVE